MKRLFLLPLWLAAAAVQAGGGPSGIAPDAEIHVTRVVEALRALRADPTNREANARANQAFRLLLTDRSAAGDEALAALAGHYLGDSQEPECEILLRGPRMIPLLERFDGEPPDLALPVSATHSRAGLTTQIRAGTVCE